MLSFYVNFIGLELICTLLFFYISDTFGRGDASVVASSDGDSELSSPKEFKKILHNMKRTIKTEFTYNTNIEISQSDFIF